MRCSEKQTKSLEIFLNIIFDDFDDDGMLFQQSQTFPLHGMLLLSLITDADLYFLTFQFFVCVQICPVFIVLKRFTFIYILFRRNPSFECYKFVYVSFFLQN